MTGTKDKHNQLLVNNKLNRIENRLRRVEILLLKSIKSDKKLKKELQLLEKEEKIIQIEQKKLEHEENKLLGDMEKVEEEEKWHIEVQYNCKSKIMDDNNIVMCHNTNKLCELSLCPNWAEKKKE